MDSKLQERAEIISQWIETLEGAEEAFMNLEASEDALFGEIFLGTSGTVDERKAKTNCDPRLKQLRQDIALAKKEVNKARRMHELALRAGDWEYGSFKLAEAAIKRG